MDGFTAVSSGLLGANPGATWQLELL
jgi:hypothetical protein